MTKYLAIVLVIILILGAVYFTFFSKINNLLFNKAETPTPTSVPTSVEIVNRPKTPTPTLAPDPESDLTALDKDLSDLDKTNIDLTKDINSL